MIEIIEINIQVVAQSDHAKKDAIKMVTKLLAEWRQSNNDNINLQTDNISEGHFQIEKA